MTTRARGVAAVKAWEKRATKFLSAAVELCLVLPWRFDNGQGAGGGDGSQAREKRATKFLATTSGLHFW